MGQIYPGPVSPQLRDGKVSTNPSLNLPICQTETKSLPYSIASLNYEREHKGVLCSVTRRLGFCVVCSCEQNWKQQWDLQTDPEFKWQLCHLAAVCL